VAQQQAHQLRAGIAGGAEHADFRFNGHGSILIQSLKGLPDQGQQRGHRERRSAAAKIRRHGKRFIRESAPVPWQYGGGGGSLLQQASSFLSSWRAI
jgi:hypothetical protein